MYSSGVPGFPLYDSLEEFESLVAAARGILLSEVRRQRAVLLQHHFDEAIGQVRSLILRTGGFRTLESVTGPGEADVMRFLPRWPVSNDVLKSLIQAGGLALASGETAANFRNRCRAEVVRQLWDPTDYPWLSEPAGEPSPDQIERTVAVVAERVARQRAETAWRKGACDATEKTARDLSARAGYAGVRLARMASIADLAPGHYTLGQTRIEIAGEAIMADQAIRFGAPGEFGLLLIEAKFAADVTNSHKRLRHECQKKADAWRTLPGVEVLAFFDGITSWDKATGLQSLGIHFLYGHDQRRLDDYVHWLAARR